MKNEKLYTKSILTTVVGSYPVPVWFSAYPSLPNLQDALRAVMKIQENASIDVISDGELSRFDINHPDTNGMIEYFIRPLGGIRSEISRQDMADFRKHSELSFRMKPAGVVEAKITEGTLDLPGAWELIKPIAAAPCKYTITSPYMLARTLLDRVYNDIRELTLEIAEVLAQQAAQIDAPVIQIDEAHLPGHTEDADWVHEPINRILKAVSGERALHLCFGNYGGQSIQEGTWKSLIGFLNRLDADHLILEFARRGYRELDLFKELKDSIALGIGVIDIKDNRVETPEEIARGIEKSVKTLGAERIRWVHPDCGFWMLSRSIADRKLRALSGGRDLYLGSS
ncbi:MAG: cobalamin-independent methionine synthase II family protein [Spirochaetia bacterium]